MITIHHATAKKAANLGIDLAIVSEEGVRATLGKSTVFSHDPKFALNWVLLAETLRAEYPVLSVVSYDAEGADLSPFSPDIWDAAGKAFLNCEDFEGDAPSLAQLQELCEEQGVDMEATPEEAEDEEPEASGSVVAESYRARYRELGHPSHCGDWLATFLDGRFDVEGVFDPYAFETFLRANFPYEGKWTTLPDSGARGWQGRYRMNGRQALEKHIALRGTIIVDGETIEIPAEALASLREKHAKWIAKQTKA